MELEAIEPAHAALAPLSIVSKDPMRADALVVADRNWGRIDKGDTRCLAALTQEVERQGQQGGWHQLDKARIADQTGKFIAQMLTYVQGVECLEIAIMRLVKVDQNRHLFTHVQPAAGPRLRPIPNCFAFSHVAIH